jgi:tagatose 6-phosphate kinase
MVLIVTINPCIDKTVCIKRNEVGKIINARKVKVIAGGKGNNVARVLKKLGISNISLNLLGGNYGKVIEDCLKKDGINYKPVWIKSSSRTVITVLEDDLRQTAYVEPGPHISDIEKKNVIEVFTEILDRNKSEIKLVVLSGSTPSKSCNDIYKIMIEIARERKIRVILDSRGEALKIGLEAKPFLIKPNIKELEDILKIKLDNNDREDKNKLVNYVIELNKHVEIVVLTMGNEGSIISDGKKIYKAIPPRIKAINSVGSGDSFIAGFVYGINEELDLLDSVRIATAAGVANVSMWDAASCSYDQIMQFVDKVKVEEFV